MRTGRWSTTIAIATTAIIATSTRPATRPASRTPTATSMPGRSTATATLPTRTTTTPIEAGAGAPRAACFRLRAAAICLWSGGRNEGAVAPMAKKIPFDGDILIIGFGSVGHPTLPLLLRHLDMPAARIAVVAADDHGAPIAPYPHAAVSFS